MCHDKVRGSVSGCQSVFTGAALLGGGGVLEEKARWHLPDGMSATLKNMTSSLSKAHGGAVTGPLHCFPLCVSPVPPPSPPSPPPPPQAPGAFAHEGSSNFLKEEFFLFVE